MTFYENDTRFEETVCTPIVKNTFITLKSAEATADRRRSLPASLRLCSKDDISTEEGNLDMGRAQADSEISTDVCTECSFGDVESGCRTPDVSDDEDSVYGRSIPGSPVRRPLLAPRQQNDVPPPPAPLLSTRPMATRTRPSAKLSSAAPAFKPLGVKEESTSHLYDHHFSRVIKTAIRTIRDSQLTSNVEVSENVQDCAIVIRASSDSVPTETVLELAHHALLDAASHSKCIFVMGFSAEKPFNQCPLGSEVFLAAMESAQTACWHVYKKGFCRHGDDCRKQHPTFKMPVRILVETSQLTAPIPSICDFKLQVADFVSNVVLAIEQSGACALVEAKKEPSKCWTIEMTPKADGRVNEEYVLSVAKNLLHSQSSTNEGVYMLGYAAKPFMPRSNGCVVVLGDMVAETRACWDFYSKGSCRKGCACKWEHPKCSMPVNIVIKPKLQTR